MASPLCQAGAVLEDGLHAADPVPELRSGDFACGALAMQLRLYLSGPSSTGLPCLPIAAANGPRLCLWGNGEATRAMRLTTRCMDLLRLLRGARWLTTSQVKRRFFGHVTPDAARKRLLKLTEADYLVRVQPDRTREALFTLGREGKRVLEKAGSGEIVLEHRPPKQLEHFHAINHVRVAAELGGPVSFFFSCWELPSLNWQYPIIPDAVFSVRNKTFALELDRGMERIQFFVRTKIAAYRNGLGGLPLTALLIVTEGNIRMESLARAIGDGKGRILYITIDLVEKHDITASIFRDSSNDGRVALV